MAKFLGFLYFDSSALFKYLYKETGSDIVNFLAKEASHYNYNLYTSEVTIYEIAKKILTRKVKQPEGHKDYISKGKYDNILHRVRKTLEQRFHIIDKREPHIKQKNNYSDIMRESSLTEGDARHWAVVLNYLEGWENVKIVSSDKDFNKFIEKEGFKIINPQKTSIVNLKKIL